MELLHNGYTLKLCKDAFPLSTDSIALSGFVKLSKNATVLDLCSGCGTLGLLLCSQNDYCHITGVELSEDAHRTALQNAADNHITDRLTSICADVCTIPSLLKAGSFDCCVANPPYFSGGPASKATPTARRDDLCSMEQLMQSAAWALKYGGDFFLVHRPERLAELFICAGKHGLEPKRLQLLRHKANGPVSLVLVQCRKGANPGLIWEEVSLHDENDNPTEYYKKLYHLQEVTK